MVSPEPLLAAGQGSRSQARTTTPLGTKWSARSNVGRGIWRGGTGPIGCGGTDKAGEWCRRGGNPPIELSLAAVRSWEAGWRRQIDLGKLSL